MKSTFVLAFSSLFLLRDNKANLLFQTWRQVGAKSFGKEFKLTDRTAAETLKINYDGTYEKTLYGNLHYKGRWLFNVDSTKLAFSITEIDLPPKNRSVVN